MSQAVTAEAVVITEERDGFLDRISDIFFARPKLLTFLFLLPPLYAHFGRPVGRDNESNP